MPKHKPLAPDVRKRFVDAARRIYNSIGYDVGWADKTPTKSEFVDVISDQIDGPHGMLSKNDIEDWYSLSFAEKRRIILEVGP